MTKDRILIVDDEWNMRKLLSIHLGQEFEVVEARNGKKALEVFGGEKEISLIILDIMMPDMSGWEVCREIRQHNETTPILMLTARFEIKDKVQGFDVGADDYLVKPYQAEELLARVKALIRRSNSIKKESLKNSDDEIEIHDLRIDQHAREVYVKDQFIELTPKEYELILLFVLNPKSVYTRDMLLDLVWGIHEVLDIRTVDSHIKNLREKFRKNKLSFNPIKTVWGVGYKFHELEADK
ncbi:MAG: response regulator transcription factor [Bacillota bacterium]